MNYNRCLKHAIVVYLNLLDHIGLDDVILLHNSILILKCLSNYLSSNHVVLLCSLSIGHIWVLIIRLTMMMMMQFGQQKKPIIRLTTMEMHQNDRVKLQFDMQQKIPVPPTCLGDWHQQRVDAQ